MSSKILKLMKNKMHKMKKMKKNQVSSQIWEQLLFWQPLLHLLLDSFYQESTENLEFSKISIFKFF